MATSAPARCTRMRECFFGTHSVRPTHDNVLGVLSLIIYSLFLVISIKYVAIVMRADNQGEGGVLALTALIPGRCGRRRRPVAAGRRPTDPDRARHLRDGAAVRRRHDHAGDHRARRDRGSRSRHAVVPPYVVPITVVILIGLVPDSEVRHASRRRALRPDHGRLVRDARRARRRLDRRGCRVSSARSIRATPSRSLRANGFIGFAVLGAVFLVVTGGEALYADMGHFGRSRFASRGLRWCSRHWS